MPSSTITLTANVPAALADNYGLAAGAGRAAGSVITVDHEIGLNLIRQGYAQAGNHTGDRAGETNSLLPVLLTANVPAALAATLGLSGAQTLAGATVNLRQNDALQLIRAGVGEFVDEHGDQSRGHNPHSVGVATLDFPSIPAAGQAELTIAVPGAVVGDPVVTGAPAGINAGLVSHSRVSAADTVTVRVSNITGAAIDPASATWKVAVVKF